jgi:RNA polymerase sigma factor (sigma-70 family)
LRKTCRRIIRIEDLTNPEHRLKDRLQSLLERDGPKLFALLTRLTLRQDAAHDLFQQLFVQLAGAEAFRLASSPSAYATRAAINLAFGWRRNRGREQLSLEAEPAAQATEPLDRLIDVEQIDRTLAAMHDLSDLVREALVLRFIEDLSYDDCAARMNKTAHQVRGLCHAGVRQLRERLAPESSDTLRQVHHD